MEVAPMRRKASVSWRDVDKRMRRAAELRQQGLSLRKIADQLAVTHTTVKRDLERWEASQVDRLLEHLGGTYEGSSSRMFRPNVPDPTDRRMQ
jgi:IS30 family transposase